MDSGAQHSVTCASLQELRTPEGRLQVAANVLNREIAALKSRPSACSRILKGLRSTKPRGRLSF